MKRVFIAFIIITGITGAFTLSKRQPVAAGPEKVAEGEHGMVVSAHPLATEIGVQILKKGGNAVDAAVAVHFALAVVYPGAGNLGGGGFLVYRDKNGAAVTLDFREKSPGKARVDMFLDSAGQVVPERSRLGGLASGVPGSVDGLWTAHKRFGKLSWKKLLEPARKLAERGFQVTAQEAGGLNDEAATFRRFNGETTAFTKPDGWKEGDVLKQSELALTLKRIQEQGRDGFYTGETARLIEAEMKRQDGLITAADLAGYSSLWRTPHAFNYKDLHVITMPPPSSGGILLHQMMTMTGQKQLEKLKFHSAEAVHLMAEAERRAYSDRAVHLGDPDFWPVPVNTLTDSTYLHARMADYNPKRASMSTRIKSGDIPYESKETTHFSIVDAEGNAVALTTTLNDRYGSRVVVAGAGFLMNNEMDDLSAKPGEPNLYGAVGGAANAVAPGKRPLSSMTPTIVVRNGSLWLVAGTPGGTTIPTTVFQIITNTAIFGMSLPEAVQAGRFHHQWKPDAIQLEPGALPDSIQTVLKQLGHTLTVRPGSIGRVDAVIRLPNGRWQGVADTRGDDAAMGW